MTRAGLAAACLLATACGAARTSAFQEPIRRGPTQGSAAARHDAARAAGDAAWQRREDPAQAREALARWEEAGRLVPDDAATWTMAARAAYYLADGFLSGGAHQPEYVSMHERGIGDAERALAAGSPELETRVRAGTKLEDAVEVVDRSGVGALYWYAANLGRWAATQGFRVQLRNKDRILAVIRRVAELDPDYFYGGADRYLGAYYAIAPALAGGDLAQSLLHFQRAVARQPYYLATHTLIAEHYAVKKQDKALFRKELEFVLAVPDDALPEVRPENRVEKARARRLLADIDEKF